MRLSIRTQLAGLLFVSSSVGVAVLGLAVWFISHNFVLKTTSDCLETAASLKAAQIAASLDLMYTASLYLTAFGTVQQALQRYNNGSTTSPDNWRAAADDLSAALNNLGALNRTPALQAQVYARRVSEQQGTHSVFNVTGPGVAVTLPWSNAQGSPAQLGEGFEGYPPSLYPNFTFTERDAKSSVVSYIATYNGSTLGLGSNLVLGPLTINDSFSLLSMTLPVTDNHSETNLLGWITIVQSTRLIQAVLLDETGLGNTGQTVIVGPVGVANKFPVGILGSIDGQLPDVQLQFPLGPRDMNRHLSHPSPMNVTDHPFPAETYPAVAAAIRDDSSGQGDLGSILDTHTEIGTTISAAYAMTPDALVDWIVIVEKSKSEVWEPIRHRRDIILACLLSVTGFFLVAAFPIAHWFVLPITRLKAATQSTIDPLYRDSSSGHAASSAAVNEQTSSVSRTAAPKSRLKVGLFQCRAWRTPARSEDQGLQHEKRYHLPSRVTPSRRWLKDDISDLTEAFNEMSDELLMQYTKLEEKVHQRTIELEQSKEAAEAANESKTIFVANVSHELKTPLNAILGMCAVCLEENDFSQMKASMSVIYNSGDLLLRTLNDLLTFSINQIGRQELALDEKEFVLQDLETQVLAIFGQPATARGVKLRVHYEEVDADSPSATSRLEDMVLWGDVNRIMQILVNLISNSLKHTPPDGQITLVLRRLTEPAPRRPLLGWDQGSQISRQSRNSARLATIAEEGRTANFINPKEHSALQEHVSAPPGDDVYVEFEVHDTGEGIAEDMQSRIFEPFVQGNGGLDRKHSGTGLGLSICLQLTTLMRGTILLNSTLGKGSTFTVKLPLRHVLRTPSVRTLSDAAGQASRWGHVIDAEVGSACKDEFVRMENSTSKAVTSRKDLQQRPSSDKLPAFPAQLEAAQYPASQAQTNKIEGKATESQPGVARPVESVQKASRARKPQPRSTNASGQHDFAGTCVLVVEDNRVNQQVILRMLKLKQISKVTVAEDGMEALELVKARIAGSATAELQDADSSLFDIVFMDIQMPNMDGLTSTRLIRQLGFRQPIVALTAFAEQSNISECYSSGMDDFLAKPLNRTDLEKVLVRFCSSTSKAPAISDGQGHGNADRD